MTRDEIKTETQTYVQVMETNYNDRIAGLNLAMDKLKKSLQNEKNKNVDKVSEKSEIEQLFVDCVEDVRKDIIRRRLKAEVSTR